MASPTSTAQGLRLGWIGLGSMGNAMAKNIHRHLVAQDLPALRFFNRTESKGDALEALGGVRYASAAAVAVDSDVVFISASDDEAVQSIIEQIVSSSGDISGKTIVDTTTVHPDTTKAATERLRGAGADFAAAPVFGATPVAEAGRLLVAFAGATATYERVVPFLERVVAREVLRVGEVPEQAMLLKTTGNFLMAGLMELIAEAHVLAEKTGLPAAALEGLLERNFGAVAHSDSVRMTTGVYLPERGQAPWSGLDLALKDVGHGVALGRRAGAPLPAGELALGHLRRAKAWAEGGAGGGEGDGENGTNIAAATPRALDSSSLYGVVRQDAGLDFRTEFVKKRDAE